MPISTKIRLTMLFLSGFLTIFSLGAPVYWEAPPEMSTFFSLQVYERVGKSVISLCKIGPKGLMMHFMQGTKKLIFTTCHSGKLKLAFTSPDFISTSPKSFLMSRIGFTVLLLFEFLKKHHLPVGQVKNRIH